jgi:hypothetical protein
MRKAIILSVFGGILGLAASAKADVIDPTKDPTRNAVLNWFKANNKDGANAKVVDWLAKLIDADVSKGRNFSVKIGANWTKAGKAYLIQTWGGRAFLFELSDARVKALGLKPTSLSYSWLGKPKEVHSTSPVAKLSLLKIDNATGLDGSKDMTGQVSCQTLGQAGAKVYVRISFSAGGYTHSKYLPLAKLPGGTDNLKFTFSAVNKGVKTPHTGPLVVFLELVVVKSTATGMETTVVSNTVAAMVDVTAAKASTGPNELEIIKG